MPGLFGFGVGGSGGAATAVQPEAAAISAKAGIWEGTLNGAIQAGRVVTAASVVDIIVYDVQDRTTGVLLPGAIVLCEIVGAGDVQIGGVTWPLNLLPLTGVAGAYRGQLPSAAALAGENNVKLRTRITYRGIVATFDTLLTVTSRGIVGGTSTGVALPATLETIPLLVHDWDPENAGVATQITDTVGTAHAIFGAGAAAPARLTLPPEISFDGGDEAITPATAILPLSSGIMVIRNDHANDGTLNYFFNTPNITGGAVGFRLGLTSPTGQTTSFLVVVHGLINVNLQQNTIAFNARATVGWRRSTLGLDIFLNAVNVASFAPIATLTTPAAITFGKAAGAATNYFVGRTGRAIEANAAWTDYEVRHFHGLLKAIYADLPDAP